ncbi:NADP-dependent oxidoreductase [Streptomyces sp. RPA4-5]|uniref:NADP-dependent oxidoreductase n=1 Tax=Streptomyces TaxID=1883 RepID=UPI00143E9173|nr:MULTISPECIES: NADP-dependent oxidoreductase [Streptomyces]MCX4640550.1 NADP-dependent oxidoreductase [Streptomyces platensis]QIY53333.1 NADP-dependent oxidoreductase [Streptomyces sp. RPA4-5]
MTDTVQEWQLAARPVGRPVPGDFRLVERELPAPADGEVWVRNTFLSVDPYMRALMSAEETGSLAYALDRPMTGGAVGEVVVSRVAALSPGDLVLSDLGWRTAAVAPAGRFTRLRRVEGVPDSAFLGVLGMPGLSAYVGLTEIAQMRPGDTVFVSGAAGAVGSLAGQIARLRGAKAVIGSAGSAAKVEYLTGELGFTAAFNYKTGPVRELLAEAAPDGIDVYFDNVGGDHLEAAIDVLKPNGRAALCGAISGYHDTEPAPGPRNMIELVKKRITLRGFEVGDHAHLQPRFAEEMGGWLAERKITFRETVEDGIGHAVEAFLGLMNGRNTGKMVVRI